MTDAEVREAYRRVDTLMRSDLEHYCRTLVRIQTKTGGLAPFVWNDAQRTLHARLERQIDEQGWVRALILKARQLGISTYTAARFYQRTTLNLGRRSYILTHEDKATQQLFGMVKRIHDNMPGDFRPETLAANANELAFAEMDSGYRVGTAKNTKGSGRSLTIHHLHGSEVAFWERADTHLASILQALAPVPGTEAIFESTANGVGGPFYDMWALAERGQGDFIPIFLPWYVEGGYRRTPPAGFRTSTAEDDYARLYGLDEHQIAWAHFKNLELHGTPGEFCPLFHQEYPATAAEAFQTTGTDSFIASAPILAARRFEAPEQDYLPRVLGVDVARGGGDLTRLVDRQGRKAGTIDEVIDRDDLVFIAHRVMETMQRNPDIRRAFIDVTGLGAGVYDICRANGFETRVVAVNFGSAAQDEKRFANRRAEMWWRVREWLLDPGGADIPDNDVAHRHLAAPSFRYDLNSRFLLEKKEDIKKRLGVSPDWGDALALTFAEIIPIEMPDETPEWARRIDEMSFGDPMLA